MSDNAPKSWLEIISEIISGDPQNRHELIDMLRESKQREILDADVLAMVESTIMLAEMRVRDVQVPRAQMSYVKENTSLNELVKMAAELGCSRFPVFDEDEERVVGVLLAKDLLQFFFAKDEQSFSIPNLMRPAMFVPESKRLDALLREFRVTHNHMAIVVDEYGGVDGLVTIEDVIEQIVGEIEDEHDIDEDADNIRSQGDNRFIVKAITPIEDFNAYFKSEFPDEQFDTVGGLVTDAFSYVPKRGEFVELSGFRFTVLHANNRCVRLVEVSMLAS